MFRETIVCDRCRTETTDPWVEIRGRADIIRSDPPSMHLCKGCAVDFLRWLDNEEAERMKDLVRRNVDLQKYIAEHVVCTVPETREDDR